jgi:hypothetical protein
MIAVSQFRRVLRPGAACFWVVVAALLIAFPSSHARALEIESVLQEVSLILNGGSIGGDGAEYRPNCGCPGPLLELGPVMTSDTRNNGAGFTTMAAYLNFDGLGAVEAQYANLGSGNQTSAFSEYVKRVFNDGTSDVPIHLLVNIQPGFVRIDNDGGTPELPVNSSLSFQIGASNPDFAFSQPTIIWSYAITLTGPSDASVTVVTLDDPRGLGTPANTQSTVIGSVIEDVDGISFTIDLGTLEPGQDIAFSCNVSVRVIGHTDGGQSRLGDAFDLIAGNTGAMGNSCKIDLIYASSFEGN